MSILKKTFAVNFNKIFYQVRPFPVDQSFMVMSLILYRQSSRYQDAHITVRMLQVGLSKKKSNSLLLHGRKGKRRKKMRIARKKKKLNGIKYTIYIRYLFLMFQNTYRHDCPLYLFILSSICTTCIGVTGLMPRVSHPPTCIGEIKRKKRRKSSDVAAAVEGKERGKKISGISLWHGEGVKDAWCNVIRKWMLCTFAVRYLLVLYIIRNVSRETHMWSTFVRFISRSFGTRLCIYSYVFLCWIERNTEGESERERNHTGIRGWKAKNTKFARLSFFFFFFLYEKKQERRKPLYIMTYKWNGNTRKSSLICKAIVQWETYEDLHWVVARMCATI